MKRVFICHPLGGDINGNMRAIRTICHRIVKQYNGDIVPVAPQLSYPQFLDDTSSDDRRLALRMCICELDSCEELWIVSRTITDGMVAEIEWAADHDIAIKVKDF